MSESTIWCYTQCEFISTSNIKTKIALEMIKTMSGFLSQPICSMKNDATHLSLPAQWMQTAAYFGIMLNESLPDWPHYRVWNWSKLNKAILTST